jgi:hypothetical protein
MSSVIYVMNVEKKTKMNRYEQEKANDLKRIAIALEKLTKLLTQVIKDNA